MRKQIKKKEEKQWEKEKHIKMGNTDSKSTTASAASSSISMSAQADGEIATVKVSSASIWGIAFSDEYVAACDSKGHCILYDASSFAKDAAHQTMKTLPSQRFVWRSLPCAFSANGAVLGIGGGDE